MSNTIKKRESNFTQVSNSFLRNNDISFKAKGLFCYMFSMNESWNFTIKSIATQQKDGESSIISSLKELKELGYINYTKHQDGTGTYFLNDEPNVEKPNVENPNLGKSTRIKKKQLTKNNNTKINVFDSFLNQLKNACKYKTKITKTKEGEVVFKQIEDKSKLFKDYISHQEEKNEFAVRITSFMQDYNTVYNKTPKQDDLEDYTW